MNDVDHDPAGDVAGPIDASGQILLKHHLEPDDISITRFAKAARLSQKHVSQIIYGHAALSPGTRAPQPPSLPRNELPRPSSRRAS